MTTNEKVGSRAAFHPIAVALEGGGALDAFSWGVLDQLLEDPRIRIDALSGTSGGAMNAAMTAQGLATGGRSQAKHLLEKFWNKVAKEAGSSRGVMGQALHFFSGSMAPFVDAARDSMGATKDTFAPWVFGMGPSTPHSLRRIVADLLDPRALISPDAPRIVIAATSVRTGEPKLFWNEDLTVDALLASSCLPTVFPAVEIKGELYWDGCFVSNPPLLPLIEGGAPSDIVVVRVAPARREKAPINTADVRNRVSEISFGASLQNDLRALSTAQKLVGNITESSEQIRRFKNTKIHIIGADEEFASMNGGSRLDPTWSFLSEMRGLGRQKAGNWLETFFGAEEFTLRREAFAR